MRRNFKPLVVVAVLAIASILTVTRRGTHGVGLGVGEPLRAMPSTGGDKKPYDLAALHIFDSALKRINDAYVDPTRIDPKAMLLAALDQVQKQVAEVMVEPRAEQNRVLVRVDTAQQEFDVSGVDSPWSLAHKAREIFKFVSAHVQPGTDLKELEYAATNGMLNTLDPHSVLLDPTVYAEMKLTTKGQFGGLGIVIGIRKGFLTVIKPMANTPASAAGLKSGDRIMRIEKQSTVNMMLNDAVSRLRGEPGTRVEIWMQRGDTPARRVVLTRAIIQVDNVLAHMLPGGIGYIKLKQFAGNTVEEMRRAIDEMKPKGLKGLVLDLRGDPGGLLDQAIRVADEFLDSGTIVSTVGLAGKQRDEKRATPGNQPKIPLAVLVNGGSASASEIVAGALKNLDRAVIIGSRTFGKGSVQVLYDNDDGSALKLTIAQYLTPGDISIQSVGILPDIALEITSVDKDRIALFRPNHNLREQDLDAHLTSQNARAGDKPIETVRYLVEQAKKKKDAKSALRDDDKEAGGDDDDGEEPADDELPPDDDKFVEDYEITFARELIAQAKGWRRHEVLGSSKPFFDHKTGEEQTKLTEALKKLGVDWSAGPAADAGAKPQLAVQLTTDRVVGGGGASGAGHAVAAGEVVVLKATVSNKGTVPAWQVRAITKCDDPFLADREFMFGRIGPGESRSWSVPVKVERGALARLDMVKVEVTDQRSAADEQAPKLASEPLRLRINGLARPRFAYAYQVIDDVRGNGDGLVQGGEEVRLHVTVKNVGEGKSYQTQATLSNKSGDGVDVNKGRFSIDHLAPGETKSVDFTFEVSPDYNKAETFTLQMDVYDQVLHEYVTDKLTFPLAARGVALKAASGAVVVARDDVNLRAGAADASSVIGHAAKNASFKLTGRGEHFYRVEIEPGRPAFLAMNDGTERNEARFANATSPGFTPSLQVAPPRLQVENPPLLVSAPTVKVRVKATDDRQIADSFVFVTNRTAKIEHRKVFYRSNRNGQTPNALQFEADIPLWSGVNHVTIVARQSNQVQSQQTLMVTREGGGPAERRDAAAMMNSK